MANMGYCRFQNTLEDLRDCYDHLDDVLDGQETGQEERKAAEKLIRCCVRIADDYGHLVEK